MPKSAHNRGAEARKRLDLTARYEESGRHSKNSKKYNRSLWAASSIITYDTDMLYFGVEKEKFARSHIADEGNNGERYLNIYSNYMLESCEIFHLKVGCPALKSEEPQKIAHQRRAHPRRVKLCEEP